jgi:hypothetical protein
MSRASGPLPVEAKVVIRIEVAASPCPCLAGLRALWSELFLRTKFRSAAAHRSGSAQWRLWRSSTSACLRLLSCHTRVAITTSTRCRSSHSELHPLGNYTARDERGAAWPLRPRPAPSSASWCSRRSCSNPGPSSPHWPKAEGQRQGA